MTVRRSKLKRAITDLAVMAVYWPVEEWRERTWYGRLWLPVDYVLAVLQWAVVISAVIVVGGFAQWSQAILNPPRTKYKQNPEEQS